MNGTITISGDQQTATSENGVSNFSNLTFLITFIIPMVMIGTMYLTMGYKFYPLLNSIIAGFFIMDLLV
jgi:hypothetical protein